jgi:mannosyltransferase OCH1-like enzyme
MNKEFILLTIILCLIMYIIYPYFCLKSYFTKDIIIVQNIPENYNKNIPLQVFQTWNTKVLPPKMKETVEYNKKNNPEINFYLYDDKDCREFIKSNFDHTVIDAFDTLKPGAYKADLWRYCILYQYGGAYIDIKFKCYQGFKLKNIMKGNFIVMDRPAYFRRNFGIYNAFMIFDKRNPFLLKAIQKTVQNVQKRKYSYNNLYVTGPGMLGEIYLKYKNISPMVIMKNKTMNNTEKMEIIYDKKPILVEYNEYRSEINPSVHYAILWHNKDIYNKIKDQDEL